MIEESSFDEFLELFKLTFTPVKNKELSARKLQSLRQRNRSEYGYNTPALKEAFYNGLNERIKDELASRDEPRMLNQLLALAIRLDNRSRKSLKSRTIVVNSQSNSNPE